MSFIDGLKSTEEREGEKPCWRELSVPGSGTIVIAYQSDSPEMKQSRDIRSTDAGLRAGAGCIPRAALA
jgi:hypothetical protein